MLKTILLALLLLTAAPSADAQRSRRAAKPVPKADTPSVVLLPESQRPRVDSSATAPSARRNRRMRVAIVPAPPAGRSRQEVLYSDSLVHRPR